MRGKLRLCMHRSHAVAWRKKKAMQGRREGRDAGWSRPGRVRSLRWAWIHAGPPVCWAEKGPKLLMGPKKVKIMPEFGPHLGLSKNKKIKMTNKNDNSINKIKSTE